MRRKLTLSLTVSSLLPLFALHAHAGGEQPAPVLPAVEVQANRFEQIGVANSANQGVVTAKQLENRPLLRTSELLEAVPGVIVTQHSGDGKANQYFVRGFNLDHGTDFRTSVIGMPVNMPSHAHGQGYSDLNYLIPELVRTIDYKKGTYYADEGDFSAAGAAAFDYVRTLDKGIVSVELGQHRYHRTVVANSSALANGTLLYALEKTGQDGPWDLKQDYRRFNGLLSWSWKDGSDALRVSAMALQSSWNATDQVPQRALNDGRIGRYGNVDPTDGGVTARQSVSADWSRRSEAGILKGNAYLIRSKLDLFSNFTYALDDSVNGDQFNQYEQRTVAGLNLERTWFHALGATEAESTLGVQLRHDRIAPVALYASKAQQRLSTVREDRVNESSAGVFGLSTLRWLPWLRTVAGVRADDYVFDVKSDLPANSGRRSAHIVSPKFSVIGSLSPTTEAYLNWGQGFHSNDARGITGTIDPKTGDAIAPATPLVRATGKEVGVRLTGLAPNLQTSISLWQLDLASELLFVGDAGTTEAGRPSHRTGIELANYYTPLPGWIIDADWALSRARFRDADAAGPFIPGAIEGTFSLGITGESGKFSGGVRLRYFGSRPLIEDNSVRSPASTLLNAKLTYAVTPGIKLSAVVLNLLNRKASDTDYFYASRLPGETQAFNDVHTHPAEPRTLRLAVVANF